MHRFYRDIRPERFREGFNELSNFLFQLCRPFSISAFFRSSAVARFHLRIWRLPLLSGIGFSLREGRLAALSAPCLQPVSASAFKFGAGGAVAPVSKPGSCRHARGNPFNERADNVIDDKGIAGCAVPRQGVLAFRRRGRQRRSACDASCPSNGKGSWKRASSSISSAGRSQVSCMLAIIMSNFGGETFLRSPWARSGSRTPRIKGAGSLNFIGLK